MKKIGLLFVLVILLAAVSNVAAHDKGDLMLNIEPRAGLALSLDDLGFDFALGGTLHYYFTNFFGINTGWNISGSFLSIPLKQSFNGLYFSIPAGVRFSVGAFALGGGFTANIPINDHDLANDDVKGIFYMGYYYDIGFDLSGIKNRKNGFGIFYRIHGSFADFSKPVETNDRYETHPYFALSIVFQIGIQVANIPIGRK